MSTALEHVARDHARSLGYFARLVSWRDGRDAPDVLCIGYGRTIWIECKMPGEPARRSQDLEHAAMREAGAEVHVVRTVAEVTAILDADI
jgi:hypothetical protein